MIVKKHNFLKIVKCVTKIFCILAVCYRSNMKFNDQESLQEKLLRMQMNNVLAASYDPLVSRRSLVTSLRCIYLVATEEDEAITHTRVLRTHVEAHAYNLIN